MPALAVHQTHSFVIRKLFLTSRHLDCIQPNAREQCRNKRSDRYCAYQSQNHYIPRTPLAHQWVSYFALFDDFKDECSKTISSTSDGQSEQCFLTTGALTCHKWNFPDDNLKVGHPACVRYNHKWYIK